MQGQKGEGTDMHREETVLAVGMDEAARRLGLSRRTVATLVSERQLVSRKVGRRRIIPVLALEAFLREEGTDTRSGRSIRNAD
jgi:excisionase family DNA binding protein